MLTPCKICNCHDWDDRLQCCVVDMCVLIVILLECFDGCWDAACVTVVAGTPGDGDVAELDVKAGRWLVQRYITYTRWTWPACQHRSHLLICSTHEHCTVCSLLQNVAHLLMCHTDCSLVKVIVKNNFLKRHRVHMVNTDTEVLASLQLAD